MDTFNALKSVRGHMLSLPGLSNCTAFDIAVEIGYHESAAAPLTLKQLLLLNIASPASVRRHLLRLIEDGVVLKNDVPKDGRVAHYILSTQAHQDFQQCIETIRRLLLSPPARQP